MVLGALDRPLWLLVVLVGLVVVAVAGPLSSSATLSAVGQVSLFAMVGAGDEPVLALIAILVFASTEGASPPAVGSIFVACGVSGAKPEETCIPLILYYVAPFFRRGVGSALGLIPIAPGGERRLTQSPGQPQRVARLLCSSAASLDSSAPWAKHYA